MQHTKLMQSAGTTSFNGLPLSPVRSQNTSGMATPTELKKPHMNEDESSHSLSSSAAITLLQQQANVLKMKGKLELLSKEDESVQLVIIYICTVCKRF